MKNLQVSILAILISFTFSSCAQDTKKANNTKNTVELISVHDLAQANNNIQLIDVRTPAEYAEGYIKHAQNIDFKEADFMDQMSKLDKDKPVYVYCLVGGRSGKSAIQLKEAGFSKVYDLDGGLKQWAADGKEIVKGE